MFKKILVPLDGSELAGRILDRLEPVFQQDHPEVVLLHVEPSLAPQDQEKAREALEAFAETLAARRATVTTRFEVGDPAQSILSIIETTQPSLVAMSTHGESGISRWIRGSVAERVLRSCPVPLLLANPTGVAEGGGLGFKRILVPLDGSETAGEILPLVKQIAPRYEAEVILLRVERPRLAVSPTGSAALAEPGQAGEELLAPYLKHLSEEGIKVRTKIALGNPADWILKTAEDEQVDLLAMTTHGRSGPSRWLFGSIAEKVLRASPCPLLVHRIAGLR